MPCGRQSARLYHVAFRAKATCALRQLTASSFSHEERTRRIHVRGAVPAARLPAHQRTTCLTQHRFSLHTFVFLYDMEILVSSEYFWLLKVRMTHFWFVFVERPKILEIAILFGRSRLVTSAVSLTVKSSCLNIPVNLDSRKSERTRGPLSMELLVRAVPDPTSVLLFSSADGNPRSNRYIREHTVSANLVQ